MEEQVEKYLPEALYIPNENPIGVDKIKKLMSDKLAQDPGVRTIKDLMEKNKWCNTVRLTGGAVVDILEGRVPRDYDLFLNSSHMSDKEILKKVEFIPHLKLTSLSTTAISFTYKGLLVQILRKQPEKYFFTIEQSNYDIKNSRIESFCYMSYRQKRLIPNELIFNEGAVNKKAYKFRIKRWAEKGYSIDKLTKRSYMSLTWSPNFFGFLKSVGDKSYKQS